MRVACLLLAAGGSTRFGGCKLIAPIDGKPLIRHSLEALNPIFDDDLYVVLGGYRDLIQPLVEDRTQVIDNKYWRQGLGSSIAVGVAKIKAMEKYDGLLIALADQAGLAESDFSKLLEQFECDRIVAAYYANGPGVPAIFPESMFDRLGRLKGDRGAKSILHNLDTELVVVPLPEAELDIDTIADIEPG